MNYEIGKHKLDKGTQPRYQVGKTTYSVHALNNFLVRQLHVHCTTFSSDWHPAFIWLFTLKITWDLTLDIIHITQWFPKCVWINILMKLYSTLTLQCIEWTKAGKGQSKGQRTHYTPVRWYMHSLTMAFATDSLVLDHEKWNTHNTSNTILGVSLLRSLA